MKTLKELKEQYFTENPRLLIAGKVSVEYYQSNKWMF